MYQLRFAAYVKSWISHVFQDMKERMSLTKNLKVTRKQVLVAFVTELVFWRNATVNPFPGNSINLPSFWSQLLFRWLWCGSEGSVKEYIWSYWFALCHSGQPQPQSLYA